jgi:hypothetical protein
VWLEPSSTVRSFAPDSVTVGATLFTCTDWLSVAPVPPSASVAETETVESAGPSGKEQAKEPPLFVFASEPLTFVPLAPQSVCTEATSSWPGSEIV